MHVQTMTALAWVALGACLCSIAQAQGIYSCVDGKGRKITADRPIAECIDRPQREINPSGTVKRVVGPSLTAQERAAQEQKDKAAAEVRAREAEEKRRDRALLLRYPSRAVHDKERAEALDQIDVVIKAASKRTTELAGQRKAIDADFEFYKSDPAKAPASLKRRLEENDSSVAVQKRFIADQDAEKKRVNMRFDEELVKLNQLWAMGGAVPAAAAAPTGRK
ncbi:MULTISPECIES: DUF4124 domain-containing protein [unclassified Polaromonas]|nr:MULTISPECIES: DUF4124 domain-containing protein [unclassified Polaromonas]OYY38404.1 MAG: DUF4124 domain-containing protein [Polaromonas sp. 35-63-35]OYZ17460.1 MAG: DUF4124 domain-containing protein [Polaromonas sp. 16-63-31]OYZ76758.1 MAG: DUF4124 domain-containing protein [Polaromonas sp. 24-63-21]OZA47873.1 MAG: DUF4124 domain-containing protein [Polaromonas sp. 17-63-33]OZA85990.1 MAG: DUF4124 domain-containing protein [Polaromonas sp. 39-63-25]